MKVLAVENHEKAEENKLGKALPEWGTIGIIQEPMVESIQLPLHLETHHNSAP